MNRLFRAAVVTVDDRGRVLKGVREVARFGGWNKACGAWQLTFTRRLTGKDRAAAVRLVRERCGTRGVDNPLILRFDYRTPRWRALCARHLPWPVARHF